MDSIKITTPDGSIMFTQQADGTVLVQHLDVGRNPPPPKTLMIIPANQVDTVASFLSQAGKS